VSALVIDTSSWIAYFRQGSGDAIIEPALEQGTVYLPPVVASELLSGRMAERARGELEEFLLTLPLCQADIAHWLRVGRLRNSLAAKVFPSQPPMLTSPSARSTWARTCFRQTQSSAWWLVTPSCRCSGCES